MRPCDYYDWEVGLANGQILKNKRHPDDVDYEQVRRVTFIPKKAWLPIREFQVDHVIKLFSRAFIKERIGWKMAEYVHCIRTVNYAIWVFSTTGKVLKTPPDQEVYL